MIDLERSAAFGQLASNAEIASEVAVAGIVYSKRTDFACIRVDQIGRRPRESYHPTRGIVNGLNTGTARARREALNPEWCAAGCNSIAYYSVAAGTGSLAVHALSRSGRGGREGGDGGPAAAGIINPLNANTAGTGALPDHAEAVARCSSLVTANSGSSVCSAIGPSANANNLARRGTLETAHCGSAICSAGRSPGDTEDHARCSALEAIDAGGEIRRAICPASNAVNLSGRTAFKPVNSRRVVAGAIGVSCHTRNLARGGVFHPGNPGRIRGCTVA